MKVIVKDYRRVYEDLEVGDIVETESNKYMVVKNAKKDFSLMNLKYSQLKKTSYYSISALATHLEHSGVPTHGGSCHEGVVRIHKGRHCTLTIEIFN